jgi:hypothetical protein
MTRCDGGIAGSNPDSDHSQLIFEVLHETLGAGVFELSLRDVPASIFVNLLEIDDKRRGG